MNLLECFFLQQSIFSKIHAELFRLLPEPGSREAKVELSLTPRIIKDQPEGPLPAYQLTASLDCKGKDTASDESIFHAQVVMEAVYQQVSGDPIAFDEFSNAHPSLTRQIYPMLLQQLRMLLTQLGLTDVKLPSDLAAKPLPKQEAAETPKRVH